MMEGQTKHDPAEIRASVRAYLLENCLRDGDPAALAEDTPLITGGILDSVAAVSLVSFLEERYGVEFEAHEISVEYFDTVKDIARTVMEKLGT